MLWTRTPPDWWIDLAYLTQWVDWDAWSALLSAAAVGTALWVAYGPRRDVGEQRREMIRTLLFITATAHHLALDAVAALQNNRQAYRDVLLHAAKMPGMKPLSTRIAALSVGQSLGTQWTDLLIVVDVFLSDWEARMVRFADETGEEAERQLIQDVAYLAGWADDIADFALAHGAKRHVRDDPVVASRLDAARKRKRIARKVQYSG